MIILLYPWMLALLLLPPIVHLLLPPVKGMHGDALRVPFFKDLLKITSSSDRAWSKSSWKNHNKLNNILLYIIWIFLCLAAARPQWVGEPIRIDNYGRDILMVTDISTSMLEPDFSYRKQRIDRLTAVKLAAKDFILERTEDRIGLILFATRAYLQSPLTFDKQAVLNTLWNADAGMAGNSTAIGDAVGLGLKVLRADKGNKIMILLTDGENNDGSLSMPEVLKLARDEGIKIYTIGVGSERLLLSSFFGVKMPQASALDEQSLKDIAEETKGRYFKASDTSSLQDIYKEIDKLEPNLNQEQYIRESQDLFFYPLAIALIITILLLWRQKRSYK